MRVPLDEECIIHANSQFWEQMLAMTFEPVQIRDEFCFRAEHMLGSVRLSGVWTGSIEVRIARELADEATAAMLMQPVETVGEADILDATREIANMIAGTIKSCLPRPCVMTVPEAAVESRGFCSRPRTEDSLTVAFHHAAGDLMVRVREQEYKL